MNLTPPVILVLGAGGLLGSEFITSNGLLGFKIVTHGFTSGMEVCADLSNIDEVFRIMYQVLPDVVVNFVGLTNVDYCEAHPSEAYRINVKTVENIVAWIKQSNKNIHLLHISTDQVYNGVGPHVEGNVNLSNYYSFSKYAGELVAAGVNSAILRTNFFGKTKCSKRKSLTDWLYFNLTSGNEIEVFSDVFFSPLSSATLCKIISQIISRRITGIYNLGSKNGMSKAEFAYQFVKILGLNNSLMADCNIDDVTFIKTYRPKDMRLNADRFERETGILLPSLIDEIYLSTKDYMHES